MADPPAETRAPEPASYPKEVSGWRKVWALVRLRCPRCGEGRMFRGAFAMNDPCPVCGLIFQREEGYFLGAMYVSYLLGAVVLGGAYLLATALLPHWNEYLILAGLFLPYLLLTPVVFRYSRGVWIYFDRWVCPGDASAGAFEKLRASRLGRARARRRG
jgi:uncharacterized protein (DUF983 family)